MLITAVAVAVVAAAAAAWANVEIGRRDLTASRNAGLVIAVVFASAATATLLGPAGAVIAVVAGLCWGAAAGVDTATMRIPNPTSLGAAAVVIAWAVATGQLTALAAGMGAALFLGVVWFLYPKGLGFGDVKIAPSLFTVAALGHPAGALIALIIGLVGGVVVGGISLAVSRARKPFPLGPSLIAGALTVAATGTTLTDWYLDLVS